MAMRKSTRRELYKNRELLWHLLEGKRCHFCKKLFVDPKAAGIKFGLAAAPPIPVKITIHHKDGKNNPRNDDKKNRGLAHQSCHKRHHAKETRPVQYTKVVQFRKVA